MYYIGWAVFDQTQILFGPTFCSQCPTGTSCLNKAHPQDMNSTVHSFSNSIVYKNGEILRCHSGVVTESDPGPPHPKSLCRQEIRKKIALTMDVANFNYLGYYTVSPCFLIHHWGNKALSLLSIDVILISVELCQLIFWPCIAIYLSESSIPIVIYSNLG